jgi:SAM-dependent methyltransferase
MQHGTGVDQIENIHGLSFKSGSVGTFLMADTLEHVSDPIRGMQEVHRCLREDGVAIFTSVMHFPIHAYPNDYWRFTPEAFRLLAEPFPVKAIFYAGPAGFPHTVCGVAAKSGFPAAAIRDMAARLLKVKTPAPLQLQEDAAQIIQALAARVIAGLPAGPKPPKASCPSGLGRFAHPGWYLLEGMWLDGWIAGDDIAMTEITADGMVLGRGPLDRARPDVAEKIGIPADRIVGFHYQVQLPERRSWTGPLQLWAIDSAGKRTLVRQSAPGVLMGDLVIDPRVILHSFDDASA